MDLGIAGKVALVTAGSRGLGRATALALAGEGVRVMLSGRDASTLAATRSQVEAVGVEVDVRAGDVTDPGEPARLVGATVERFGGLDIVVANAGGPPPGRALDLSDEALDAALNANLMTSVRLVREALPHMRAAGWGRICCITSYTVKQPAPVLALSNTARTGLWAWIKTAAQDLAAESSGITLNMICPGPHATDRMKELGGAGVMGDPADFGSVVAFVCSAQAGFVNGSAVVVDGGSTLAL
jgi:3-oxoacyl-[acyl-carrier protein] reductase